MFRKAESGDLDAVAAIYSRIHDNEEAGRTTIGWVRSIYPTRETAADALRRGWLYVAASPDVTASAIINQVPPDAYAHAPWRHEAPADGVLILHTLTVDPAQSGRGIGSGFVRWYEALAAQRGIRELRLDTNERNQAARALYRKLGYEEVGVVPTVFNGIPDIRLVCLEKTLGEAET